MNLQSLIERCYGLLDEVVPILEAESVDPDLKQRAVTLLTDLKETVRNFRTRKNRIILVPDREIYRDFVRFVLGSTGARLLECVGTHGYGRLADIERFSGIEFRYSPRSVWRRLHALGLLYGQKEYSYLTSRGVTAYKILTGTLPAPAKKDARKFAPIPEDKCIEDLTLKIVDHPPVSAGALILIKALGTDRIYDVSALRKHDLIKAYFKSHQEWEDAFSEVKKNRLAVVSDDQSVVLTKLGRYVWSVFFGDDQPGSGSLDSSRRFKWIDELVAHYMKQGYTVRKDEPVGDSSIRYDMYLQRGQRSFGLFYPPFDRPDSREWFFMVLDAVHDKTREDLYVVGPTAASVERAKELAFRWAAVKVPRRELTMHFATVQDVLNDREETVYLESSQKDD